MAKCEISAKKFFDEGRKFQDEGNFLEALENFNNCLRFSPNESNLISQSICARSKIFYKLKLYRQCGENIKLLKNLNSLRDEDFSDIESSINSFNIDESDEKWKFFKLSLETNKKLPFVANCIEIRNSDECGRFIATNKDLNPGDVAVLEEPFYKILSPNEVNRKCSICLCENFMNLLPCSKCSTSK